ncbi:hypothetical protein ABZ759_30465 [Streptomyces sp. NPDC047860]|uniref:hypothetical protein n=1 Tax=Streptomyces sp. NPDC047860 TaxID=3155743 RepID=UPI0033F5B08A
MTALHYLGELTIAVLAGLITDIAKRRFDKRDDHGNQDPDDNDDPSTGAAGVAAPFVRHPVSSPEPG